MLGSAHYMSPEQASGSSLDCRSDLYSLGVWGFQLLSGSGHSSARGHGRHGTTRYAEHAAAVDGCY